MMAPSKEHWLTNPHNPRGSAEFELLLCLARAHLRSGEVERLTAALQKPVVWDDFIQLARRHRLLPLCARHFNRLAPGLVPRAAMQTMRDYTEQNARRSLLLTGELRTLLQLFAEADIPAIAYKGPVLAQDVYGSIALRDILDLDILVPKYDALRARQILLQRGYRSGVPTDSHWDPSLLAYGCNFPLIKDASGFVVELHWTPEACLSQRRLGEFWDRREHVSLAGTQVPTFARHDLLLLLCLHGCRHMWERLEWVVGIAELLRSIDVSWEEQITFASSLGARRALLLGVTLAHELLDAPVPEEVLRRARLEHQMETLLEGARDQLYSDPPVLAHELGVQFHRFQLGSKERLRDRIQYIRQRAMAPSGQDWHAPELPWSLFRLYSAARRLRLVSAYSGWLWKRTTSSVAGTRQEGREN